MAIYITGSTLTLDQLLNPVGNLSGDEDKLFQVNATGTGFELSAPVDVVAAVIAGYSTKTVPVNADEFLMRDSEDSLVTKRMTWQNIIANMQTSIIHDNLAGLPGVDAHTQYALLAGRAGSQALFGGTGSGEHLDLISTAHATKGLIRFFSQMEMIRDIDGPTPLAFLRNTHTSTTADARVVFVSDVAHGYLVAGSTGHTGNWFGKSRSRSVSLVDFNAYRMLIGTLGNSPLTFGTNNEERLTILENGTILLAPTGQKIVEGSSTPLTVANMQLSSAVFADPLVSTIVPAVSSRAEVLQAWKVSDADSVFALANLTNANSRFSASFFFRDLSSNQETLSFQYETLAANDTGIAPCVLVNAYRRTEAQAFSAMSTRPIFVIRNLSTDLLHMSPAGRMGLNRVAQGVVDAALPAGGRWTVNSASLTSTGVWDNIITGVTRVLQLRAVIAPSSGAAGVSSITLLPGAGSSVIYSAGGNTVLAEVTAGGVFRVQRSAGTATFVVACDMLLV